MVVGLLGILAAGAAFVPIDRDGPAGRSGRMLSQLRAPLAVTDGPLDEGWGFAGEVVPVPERGAAAVDDTPPARPRPLPAARLAYVIFTSGSTGAPKGVMIEHGAVSRLCRWYRDETGIDATARVLLVFPFTFDAAIKNVLAPLSAGGRLVLPPPGPFHPLRELELIESRRITHLNCVPSALDPLLRLAARTGFRPLRSLRVLAFGGEPVALSQFRAWADSGAVPCRWLNLYGPAECTDLATCAEVGPDEVRRGGSPSLGGAILGRRLHVLGHGGEQPETATGELYISGEGLARGYFDAPARTAERFLPSRFGGAGARVYQTGDRVAVDEDGELRFRGRLDHQVKVRGHRVELGEVENRLLTLPGVLQAVVLPRGEGPNYSGLTARVVTTGEGDGERLREALAADLPGHMVPHPILVVDRLPTTPHGKVDRAALARQAGGDRPGS